MVSVSGSERVKIVFIYLFIFMSTSIISTNNSGSKTLNKFAVDRAWQEGR